MANQENYGKARAVWFGVVDVLILLILIGFVCSMFLIDGNNQNNGSDSSECLIFAVSVQAPYEKDLFHQEGGGNAVSLTLQDSEVSFGRLLLGDDGVFYVECEISAVERSEDREGLWMLGDTVLMSGEVLLVESQLADFSVTILSTPIKGVSGSAGTTEEQKETTADPTFDVTDDEGTTEAEDSEEPSDTSDLTSEEVEATDDAAARENADAQSP